jgi:hypothetical protein
MNDTRRLHDDSFPFLFHQSSPQVTTQSMHTDKIRRTRSVRLLQFGFPTFIDPRARDDRDNGKVICRAERSWEMKSEADGAADKESIIRSISTELSASFSEFFAQS